MAEPLSYLQQRKHETWLVGHGQEFTKLVNQRLQQLSDYPKPTQILLVERHPVKFLASFIAACAANCSIVLCNPNWAAAEWEQVFQQVQPDLIWGEAITHTPHTPHSTPHTPLLPTPLLLIPTGGSSGQVRFVMHTWQTLMASVSGFRQYFEVDRVHSFCVLPLYHVSGLMQFLRSFTSGGQLVLADPKCPETVMSEIDPTEFFLSLVPTQLQRWLAQPNHLPWLSHFRTVLLGGAPAWPELLERARSLQIRLAPTYGMTETASQIATLKPEEFLQGRSSCGRILPHAQVTIHGESGVPLGVNQVGRIMIQSKSLALGYYPNLFPSKFYQPDDLGMLDEQGYLHIIGRQSDKIITGGENVFPVEVEAAMRSTGLVTDVIVLGVSDPQWGQRIVAVYQPKRQDISVELVRSALTHKICKYKHPKHWIAVETLPRNAQGKINRQQVEAIVQAYLTATAEAIV